MEGIWRGNELLRIGQPELQLCVYITRLVCIIPHGKVRKGGNKKKPYMFRSFGSCNATSLVLYVLDGQESNCQFSRVCQRSRTILKLANEDTPRRKD